MREKNEAKLRIWEEIVGVCTGLTFENHHVVLNLIVRDKRCQLVFSQESTEGKLLQSIKHKLLGRSIAVLRTDDISKPIAVRLVERRDAGGSDNGFD
jgi:hypothetical protein